MKNKTVSADLTVVLPTLNEAGNIEKLLNDIFYHVPDAQVIVSDDNSSDDTQKIVSRMMKQNPAIKLNARMANPGLTGSIKDGVFAAQTKFVAWMDADFSHPPEYLPLLLKEARITGCAMGSRFIAGGSQKNLEANAVDSKAAVMLSTLLNFLIRFWLRLSIRDYTSGFIVCRSDALRRHSWIGDYGEYFIALMYFLERREKIQIKEIPFKSPPREWGESKTGNTFTKLFRRGVKYIWMALRLPLPVIGYGN